MRAYTTPALLAAVSLSVAGRAVAAPVPDAPPVGIPALMAFDTLPLLADRPAHQDSSYNRRHQNADAGNYLYSEVNGKRVDELGPGTIEETDKIEHVMVDTDGPGMICRIWSTGPTGRIPILNRGTWVRFYFDGEKTPRLQLTMPELFGEKGARWPFLPPLARTFESGNNDLEGPASFCYVPIPFAGHVKITTNALYFYQFSYIKYPEGTPVETWSSGTFEENRAALERASAMLQARGRMPDPPADPMQVTEGAVDIAPGKTGVLYDGAGPGIVRALRVKLQRAMHRNLRGLVLQVQYEGSGENSVNAPIGDFFGAAGSDLRYRSLALGSTDAGYYCYFPMPFRKRVRILVRNDTAEPARVYRSVAVQDVAALPRTAGYFHAEYRQDRDCAVGEDYTVLEAEGGSGKYVGCNMFMQGGIGTEAICFLEGDEAIYTDDDWEWPPRWAGTGTEDYFNGSYYWNGVKPEDRDQAFGGMTFRHDGMRRVCAYRHHVTDAVSFNRRIRVDIQHGPVSDFKSDYASTAYWYFARPASAGELPAMTDRIPRTELPAPIMMGCRFEGDFTTNGKPLKARWLRTVDPEYWTDVLPEGLTPKRMQVFCPDMEIGQTVEGDLHVPGEDWYDVDLYLSVGPGYGKVAILLDDRWVENVNLYNENFLPARAIPLGRHHLGGGDHGLAFRMLDGHEMATGSDFGIVAAHCKPITARAVREWQVIGPWPCPKEGGWERVNPPEKEQDLDAVYAVTIDRDGKPTEIEAKWRPVSLPPGGGVASFEHFGWDSWQCCYGVTYVWSPRDQVVGAFLGKDDGLAMWVNGKKVLDDNTWSHYLGDHLIADLPLKKDWNTILVKNANWLGCWAWCMRITDPKQQLRISNVRPAGPSGE